MFCRHKSSKHGTSPHNIDYEEESPVTEYESSTDGVYHYHSARLQCGRMVDNTMDAVKEGDGDRAVRC